MSHVLAGFALCLFAHGRRSGAFLTSWWFLSALCECPQVWHTYYKVHIPCASVLCACFRVLSQTRGWCVCPPAHRGCLLHQLGENVCLGLCVDCPLLYCCHPIALYVAAAVVSDAPAQQAYPLTTCDVMTVPAHRHIGCVSRRVSCAHHLGLVPPGGP